MSVGITPRQAKRGILVIHWHHNHMKYQESKKLSLLNLAAVAVTMVASIIEVRKVFETILEGCQRNERKGKKKREGRRKEEKKKDNSKF